MPQNEWEETNHQTRAATERLRRLRSDPLLSDLIGAPRPPAKSLPQDAGTQPYEFGALLKAVDSFPTLVGYLNGRRGSKSLMAVNSEADVQDVLYLMLKPVFPGLIYEQPTEKGAVGYSIGDFALPEMRLLIEAKYIDSKSKVKSVSDEMAEDIWKYATQTMCEIILFFVYDPKSLIPDRHAFIQTYSEDAYAVRGREIQVVSVIKS